MMKQPYIKPQWNPPQGVKALMSTRLGGVSAAPYNSLNLGSNTKDSPENVAQNKQQLNLWLTENGADIEADVVWLSQVHGTHALYLDAAKRQEIRQQGIEPEADACYSTTAGVVCAVRAADCMPVLLATPKGVAAIHAGWRGLAKGVVVNTLAKLLQATGETPDQVVAWLGPCIGSENFEVGEDVKKTFESQHAGNKNAFKAANTMHKWWADLPLLAQMELKRHGVTQIYTDGRCTVAEEALFYSYRRDQNKLGDTGRMAACIWHEKLS